MTSKPHSLQDAELRARMCRILAGDYRTDDVAKLFAGKRFSSRGRSAFREIGDFAAHPDMRDKGPVTDSIRDMKAILAPLMDDADGRAVNVEKMVARVEANLRLATDEQIARLYPGFTLKKARRVVEGFLTKSRRGGPFSIAADERYLVDRLAGSMLWNPVITADGLFDEFVLVMVDNRILLPDEIDKLRPAKTFITLYVLTVLHGVSYKLPDKNVGVLRVGHGNRYGVLEVTASILMKTEPKRVESTYCPLFTTLLGTDHCGSSLVQRPGPWTFPIELRGGKIEPLGEVPPIDPHENKGVAHISIKGENPQHYWPLKQ